MKASILIVEDDPHILMGLRDVLAADGFKVATCNRGDAAIAAVNEQRPELVILDVMLPGKSGYDICKELRAAKISVPVLMLTAKGQELDKVIGLDLGADDYVTKPFGMKELVARVHALLRRTQPAERAGEVLSRDELLTSVWGYHYHGTTRTLDQVIVQLRRKLGDDADAPRHLLTIHGVGYKMLP